MKSSTTCVFTIASKNYLAHVRTLLSSVRQHHPDVDACLVLCDRVDGRFEPSAESFRTINAEDLGIERWPEFAFKYTCLELNTAVKPFAIGKFFRDCGYEQVIYLDPDITVYRPLTELFDALQRHSVVLTPHLTDFLPDDGCLPDNLRILQSGVNNLGFIALRKSEEALHLTDWWCRQLYDRCRVAVADGIFVDQKWMDLALSCIESSTLLRHPGYNAAYWNLTQRRITRDPQGAYLVNGEPLAFFHFSGFSPTSPKVISKHQTRLRWSDLGGPAQSLFEAYGERLLENGCREIQSWPYAYGQFEDGLRIPDCFRLYFQKHLASVAFRSAKDRDFRGAKGDNAAALSSNDFHAPVDGGPLTVAAMALYECHPDLQAAFPRVPGDDALAYAEWYVRAGGGDSRLDRAFIEPVERRLAELGCKAAKASLLGSGRRVVARATAKVLRKLRRNHNLHRFFPKKLRSKVRAVLEKVAHARPLPQSIAAMPGTSTSLREAGINVFGLLDCPTGVGEAVRGTVACLEDLRWPHRKIGFDERHLLFGRSLPRGVRPDPKFAINYCHVNADCTAQLHELFDEESFAGRFNIGYWAWELDEFPKAWVSASDCYQEIWVPSTFVQQAVQARARIPVVRVPHCIRMADFACKDRAAWGFPQDRPVILCMFDTASYVDRKNPQAAIEAVKRAGIAHCNPLLVIKVNQAELQRGLPEQLERLVHPLECRTLVGRMSREDTLGLIDTCDMLVSLHRSEGFGLVLAEAMALGKPVVATGYSGNMDFMTSRNSCPVDFKLVTLKHDVGPYFAGARWAEPDIEHAACLIRELLDNPQRMRQIGQRAASDIAESFSVAVVSRQIRCRLESLGFTGPSTVAAEKSSSQSRESQRRAA